MVEVQWANELHDVVIWKLGDTWTWEEFLVAHKKVDALIDSVPGVSVYGVFLFSRNQTIPSNPLGNLRKVLNQAHPRYAKSIIVGANAYTMMMLNTLFKIIGYQGIYFVPTIADAYSYIETLREHSTQHIEVQHKQSGMS